MGQGGFPELPAGQDLPAFPGGEGFPGFPGGNVGGGPTSGSAIPSMGGMGAMAGSSAAPSAAVITKLTEDADRYTWVAATSGSMAAAPYQLAAQRPVMPIGGFSSTDPAPTLDQFKQYVADHRIHWFIGGGMGAMSGRGGAGAQMPGEQAGGVTPGGLPGGGGSAQAISQWVAQNFTATTIDGVTLYDLSQPNAGS
jgi:hypothetical protein